MTPEGAAKSMVLPISGGATPKNPPLETPPPPPVYPAAVKRGKLLLQEPEIAHLVGHLPCCACDPGWNPGISQGSVTKSPGEALVLHRVLLSLTLHEKVGLNH